MKICRSGLHQFEGKQCLICKNIGKKKWYDANFDKVIVNVKKWQQVNSEKVKTDNKIWRILNDKKIKTDKKKWYDANSAKKIAKQNAWQKANPDKCTAASAKRNALKLKATPKWLTKNQHKENEKFYNKSMILTKETGIPHEVDHIIPIQGETVSGLHVPWNLRVITRKENREKGNKLLQDILL